MWSTWAALQGYAVGAYVIPTTVNATGFYYKATAITTGQSGAAEPAWPLVRGATVVDGGVTWTCMYYTSVLTSDFATFDGNLKSSINGVDGGCWAPATPIVIGGAGLQLTGPLVVARGGVLHSNTGVLAFDPGNFPLLGPTHSWNTRKVVYSFVDARPIPYSMWVVRRGTSSLQSVAPQYVQNGTTLPSRLALRIRGVQYASITSVTVTFSVVTLHTSLPTTMPSFRLLVVDENGNATPCTSVAAGADVDGWCYVPTPANVTAWYNAGNAQSFTFAVDNGYVIRSLYTYVLEVRDEQGVTAFPWTVPLMQPCRVLSYGPSFPLAGLAAIDGYTPAAGDRVLVVDSPFNGGSCETGIYIASAGDWVRSTDLNQASQFGQGFVVGIQQGNSFGGTYWAAASEIDTWSPGTTPPCGAWLATSGYTANTPILPLASTTGYWYLCTTAGTTGAHEPPWPSQPGQTVKDGTVVWTCIGPAATPLPFVTRPAVDLYTGGEAANAYGTVFHTATMTYSDIRFNEWQ